MPSPSAPTTSTTTASATAPSHGYVNNRWLLALEVVVVLALTAFFLWLNSIWPTQFLYPLEADSMHHHAELACFYAAQSEASGLEHLLLAWLWPSSYPAFVYSLSYLFFSMHLLTPGISGALQSQSIYVFITFASVYAITRFCCLKQMSLQGKQRQWLAMLGGTCSLVFLGCLPHMLLYSECYMLDFPCAAIVSLSLALLFYARDLQNKYLMMASGATAGIAILTKFTAIWFFAPIIGIYFLLYLRKWLAVKRQFFWQITICALAVTTPLYLARQMPGTCEQIAKLGQNITPRAWQICILVSCLALFWLWQSNKTLPHFGKKAPRNSATKNRSTEITLSNMSRYGALAYWISSPWFYYNFDIVCMRSEPLNRDAVRHEMAEHIRRVVDSYDIGFVNHVLLCIVILACAYYLFRLFSSRRHWELAMLTVSACFGQILSAIWLGEDPRYFYPAFAMSASIFGCFMALHWSLVIPGLVAALFSAYINLTMSAWPQLPLHNWVNGDGTPLHWFSCYSYPRYRNDHNMLPFVLSYRLAPTLGASPAAPKFVLVGMPNNCNEAISTQGALQTWSAYHDYPIVSFTYQMSNQNIGNNMIHYVPRMLQHLDKTAPAMGQATRQTLFCKEKGAFTYKPPWDYFINIEQEGLDMMSDSAVKQIMGQDALCRIMPGTRVNLHIWYKPTNKVTQPFLDMTVAPQDLHQESKPCMLY